MSSCVGFADLLRDAVLVQAWTFASLYGLHDIGVTTF